MKGNTIPCFAMFISILFLACKQPISQDQIDLESLQNHTKTLSSDKFMGRSITGTSEELSIDYIAKEFQKLGLKPVNGKSYYQEVPLYEKEVTNLSFRLHNSEGYELQTSATEDFVLWTAHDLESINLTNTPLVFVGFGIETETYKWNDYKDIDVRGKIVVVLVNDPGYATRDDSIFKGKTLTRYGRWTYKIEEAIKKGAVGILLVHEEDEAGYPWKMVQNTWTGKQYGLRSVLKGDLQFEGWIHHRLLKQILEHEGSSFENLKSAAAKASFTPVELEFSVDLEMESKLNAITTNNVIGVLPREVEEYIMYTAHWDHLGISSDGEIFNGALDNAIGVAGMLEVAKKFAESSQKRSLIFIATTAEEKGLLGARHYTHYPEVPLERTVAVINIDNFTTLSGRGKDFVILGSGKSELDQYAVRAGAKQGRVMTPDPTPEDGSFFKSDQYPFALAGVPSIFIVGGDEDIERGPGSLTEDYLDYVSTCYHQTCDEYEDDWIWDGAIDDLELMYLMGEELANSKSWPKWMEDSEFKTVR